MNRASRAARHIVFSRSGRVISWASRVDSGVGLARMVGVGAAAAVGDSAATLAVSLRLLFLLGL